MQPQQLPFVLPQSGRAGGITIICTFSHLFNNMVAQCWQSLSFFSLKNLFEVDCVPVAFRKLRAHG